MINKAGKRRVWQVWNQNGTSCPDETIPIRRSVVGAKRFKKKHWTDVRVNRRTVPYAAEEGHEVTFLINISIYTCCYFFMLDFEFI